MVFPEDMRGTAFTAEDGAHTFIISGVDLNGDPINLSGTVAASLIRPDGTTTPMTGTISGGKASVTLSAECYGVGGRASLTIFLTSGGQKVAIFGARISIDRSSTAQASPGVAADVVDLVNRIDAAVATIPASYTALMAAIAPDYSSSSTYPKVGSFVWYSGTLYRSKVAIETAESWTADHWKKATLGDDLNDDITSLKSAFDITKDAITIQDRTNPSYQAGYIRDNGEFGNSSNYCRTRMLMFGSGEIIITPKSGYKIKIAEYSQGNTSYYLGLVSGNTTNSVTFIAVSGHYYAIQIGSADGSSVKEENIAVDAVTISHTAYTDNTLSAPGKSADAYTVGNDLNGIKSNMGFWYQKLIVPANTSHSASDDILNVVIPSGSVYCIVCKMDGAYHPQIYAGLQDGTSERVYIDASSTYYSFSTVLTANADIKSFGIFLSGTTSPKRTIELMILTGDSASGLFHYTNKTSAYIRYPQGMLCFKTGRSRVLVQSISVWNNQVWEFDEGHAYYNGVTYALDNGHGNSCNWGTELHGDYPYLYCPTYSDGYNVKVYSFDGTGFTLERTITLSAYTTGYMTAYVDENAGYIYSFGYSDIYSGQHMFAVSDMTGTTVMTKLIPSKIPIVQGMCMHDGILYVTSGYGNAQYPNYLNKISTDGTLLGRFRMYGIGEIEGIDFLDNKMVLASYYEFYINPVLVPEVKFYGYVDQLK